VSGAVRPKLYDLKEGALPFDLIGGGAVVHCIAEAFYDVMGERHEALAKLHNCDESGRVSEGSRRRFELFLVEWLGGPSVYSSAHGHPRLRMRHAHVPVTKAMRDAWMDCMHHALDTAGVSGTVREFLNVRFDEVATFLVNRPG
jgi:hemoglobin